LHPGQQLLRKFVLKTNSHWPFTHLNRIPYGAATRSFVLAFRNAPEVRNIYIRQGLEQDTWIPALSDIDLSVIIAGNLSGATEYKFLMSFWAGYRRLKRFFPMFGEVVILNELECPLWLRLSSYSPKPRSWVCLHGKQSRHLEADYS